MTYDERGADMKLGTRIWHNLYCRWYDARDESPKSAAVWGWLADRVVRWA